MKIVVIGDIHGRDIWKKIVEKEFDADKYIFLGDYVSTHDFITDEQQINNLIDLLNWADEVNFNERNKVILLRGNHDLQHLGYYWAECSGLFPKVRNWMSLQKEWFLDRTQWVYVHDNIVFSHAGLTTRWMNDNKLINPEDVNSLPVDERFAFTPCKMSDYCGDSETQPPVWVRPWTLIETALPNYTYVVGHTTYDNVVNLKDLFITANVKDFDKTTLPDIWLCDTLKNKQYLIIKDGEFIPTKLTE